MGTKLGQMAQEVARQNPWWRDTNWAAGDPDLRDANASGLTYNSGVLDALTPGGLYVLRGPRRVGKTVAVKQQIDQLLSNGAPATALVRVAADGWSATDLRTVVQNASLPPAPPEVPRIWFIDEISAVTGDWAQQIKWLRDNDRDFRDATVVLTGSNASALTAATGTLAGRRGAGTNLDRVLLPMGFRTFVEHTMRGVKPQVESILPGHVHTPVGRAAYESALPWLDDLVTLWEMYLQYGGFPRAVAAAALGQPIPGSFVNDLFDVIAEDAFANSKLSTATETAFLERLWTAMASPANLSSIGRDVGVGRDVVTRHVGYLRDAYLLWRCPQRQDSRWLANIDAQDKIYAIDPLVARLHHLRNSARADIDTTVLAEMQIGMALLRRIIAQNPAALNDDFLFHVRTPTRKEIDFVADDLAGAAIEGKYVEGGHWAAEAATVNASEWRGVLTTRNVLDVRSERAWAVPCAILAFCLDT